MRRVLVCLCPWMICLALLTGCGSIGDKAAGLSAVYAVAAIVSMLLLIGYCAVMKKREPWYLLLFASVMVVNIGYFALAVSTGLNEALLANLLSYLGSVFLPLSMFMIILNATNISFRRWLPAVLLSLAVVMFLIAASPGYLPIYYKSVAFEIVNGAAVLKKVYGPLHSLYLVYLLGYFGAMVAAIVYATVKKKIESAVYAVIIAAAVFLNIGVWLIEQLVSVPFEILSISYIISESFLLGINVLMAERQKSSTAQQAPILTEAAPKEQDDPMQEALALFRSGLAELTPKEEALYECYVSGLSTDVIMERLCIKENTLKFHSKNLYSKLGVKSRKQLMELHKQL